MYVAEPGKTPCSSLNPSWHHTYKISYSRPSAKIELIVLLEMYKWIFLNSNICKLEQLAKLPLVNNISTAYICFAFFEHCIFQTPWHFIKQSLANGKSICLSRSSLRAPFGDMNEWYAQSIFSSPTIQFMEALSISALYFLYDCPVWIHRLIPNRTSYVSGGAMWLNQMKATAFLSARLCSKSVKRRWKVIWLAITPELWAYLVQNSTRVGIR